MVARQLIEYNGSVLEYDTDDVEALDFNVGADVIETPNDTGSIHRELGQCYADVRLRFKPGKRATWVRPEGSER